MIIAYLFHFGKVQIIRRVGPFLVELIATYGALFLVGLLFFEGYVQTEDAKRMSTLGERDRLDQYVVADWAVLPMVEFLVGGTAFVFDELLISLIVAFFALNLLPLLTFVLF